MNTLESILARLQKVETCGTLPPGSPGCWLWTGYCDRRTGYARVGWQRSTERVHRLVYSLLVGPIPEDHELHHTCEVKHCCNPEHLEPRTRKDHTQFHDAFGPARERERTATHCRQGHEFTPENTRIERWGTGTSRRCLTCAAAKQRRRWERLSPEERHAESQKRWQREREKEAA